MVNPLPQPYRSGTEERMMNVRNKEDTMRDIGAVVGCVGETVKKKERNV